MTKTVTLEITEELKKFTAEIDDDLEKLAEHRHHTNHMANYSLGLAALYFGFWGYTHFHKMTEWWVIAVLTTVWLVESTFSIGCIVSMYKFWSLRKQVKVKIDLVHRFFDPAVETKPSEE